MLLPRVSLIFVAPVFLLGLIGCTSDSGSKSGFNNDNNFDLQSLSSLATGTYIQVYVDTEDDLATRIKIAENVVEKIEPELKDRVASKFPSISSSQIDSISIKSKSERMYWLESSSWTHNVYIEVTLGFASDEAWSILEFCSEEIQAAIRNYSP